MIPARPRLFALTLAVIVTAVVTGSLGPKGIDDVPGGFESPVLALELARTTADAAVIVDGEARRASLRTATLADLVFIVAYTSLWAVMGRRVAFVVMMSAVLAGVADLVEDAGIFTILGQAEPTGRVVDWIRIASLGKWALLGVTFVGLFFYFRPRAGVASTWDLARLAVGLGYAYSGILCLVGAFVYHPVIERAILPLSVALALQLGLTLIGGSVPALPPMAPHRGDTRPMAPAEPALETKTS